MFIERFEKVAKKKEKKKFNPHFDQAGFVKYVEKKADHIYETGFAAGDPDKFKWHFESQFPIDFALAIRSPEQWQQWFDSEKKEWVYNHGPHERSNHFDKWSEEPQLKPIILVSGTDGKLHIIDGHHRIAKTLSLKKKTVPAIIGEKNNELSKRV